MKNISNILKKIIKSVSLVVFASFVLNSLHAESTGDKFVEENGVCYGDFIRLRHNATNMYLTGGSEAKGGHYSHPRSSRQVVVFGAAEKGEDTIWIVKGEHADGDALNCEYGELVKKGSKIRLENAFTGGNLHAHNLPSPITSQGEVTSFGANGLGDSNDNWDVFEISDNHSCLSYGVKTKFMHSNVRSTLHSHPNLMNAANRWHEVTTYKYRDDNDFFIVERVDDAVDSAPTEPAVVETTSLVVPTNVATITSSSTGVIATQEELAVMNSKYDEKTKKSRKHKNRKRKRYQNDKSHKNRKN